MSFPFLSNVYSETWFQVLMVIIISIVAVVLIVFLILFFYIHNIKRSVKELEDRYESIHLTFSNDCSIMIKRLETIALNNSNYVDVAKSTKTRFSTILNEKDKNCYIAIESLKDLLIHKNYKSIKQIISSTKDSLDALNKEAVELTNDLQSILKKEEELHSMIVVWKEKYRKLKLAYDENSSSLESLSTSFNLLFNHLTKLFVNFETYLNEADYTSANKLIPEIEQLIEATNKVMTDLPSLNSLVENVIPEKIENLKEIYNDMLQEGYSLYHLNFKNNIELMQVDLDNCKSKLRKLSINGVNETCNNLMMKINKYYLDFENEKKAKQEFDFLTNTVSSSTYQAEKQFANLKNSLPTYQKAYIISNSYLGQISTLKEMIDDMSAKKRILDSYINSSTKQPYTILMSTIKELKEKIDKIQLSFDDFHNYLLTLKADTEKAYKYVRLSFVDLKVYERKIQSANLQSFSEIYLTKLSVGYEYLSKINALLNVTPIDVMGVNSIYNEMNSYLSKLYKEIDDNLLVMKRAEDLIVYDNRYRVDSLECKNKLKVIEKAFMESDFSRASMMAAEVYKLESNLGK